MTKASSKKSKNEAQQHPFSLKAIYLRESNTGFEKQFDPQIPGIPLTARVNWDQLSAHKSDIELTGKDPDGNQRVQKFSVLRIDIPFQFTYALGDYSSQMDDASNQRYEENIVARIKCVIAAEYLINPGFEPSDELIKEWGQSKAMLHAWPYWREFCQSHLMRMGLPPSIIPLANFYENGN